MDGIIKILRIPLLCLGLGNSKRCFYSAWCVDQKANMCCKVRMTGVTFPDRKASCGAFGTTVVSVGGFVRVISFNKHSKPLAKAQGSSPILQMRNLIPGLRGVRSVLPEGIMPGRDRNEDSMSGLSSSWVNSLLFFS